MSLELRGVALPLAHFTLECDAHLPARVTGVFGPSGAGKTSLLELIAGLRRATRGSVRLGDTVLADSEARIFLPARQRRIGYVPQDLALFPHLDVRRNLRYGMREDSVADADFGFTRVVEALEIGALLERNVTSLSGGEQHRVALARALLSSPRLLLLDEPLSSLDERLKQRVIPFLQRVRDEFRVPMVYVSHNPSEIRALCDDVLVFREGKVEAHGGLDLLLPRSPEPDR